MEKTHIRIEKQENRNVKGGKWRIFINKSYCKGCELCVSFCPRKVLIMSEDYNERGTHYPIPKYIEKCIGCRMCELLCPDFAIYVAPVEKEV